MRHERGWHTAWFAEGRLQARLTSSGSPFRRSQHLACPTSGCRPARAKMTRPWAVGHCWRRRRMGPATEPRDVPVASHTVGDRGLKPVSHRENNMMSASGLRVTWLLCVLLLALRSARRAQGTETLYPARPEAWLMNYYTSVTLFTGLRAPRSRPI